MSASAALPRARALFPALMSFPATCFILTMMSDIAYARSYNITWQTFSIWLLAIGLLAAVPIVVSGLVQAFGWGLWPSRASRIGHAFALILSIFNALVHSRDGYTSVVPAGLALSIIVVLILFATWIFDLAHDRLRGTA